MAQATMEFKKGDGATHYFMIPSDSWTPGGTLFFAAKQKPDADATDAAAVIDKSFDDSVTELVTVDDIEYRKYTLAFVAADTDAISFSDGSKKKTYLGEFQHVPTVGPPSTFPGDDDFIKVIVYADIKRGVS